IGLAGSLQPSNAMMPSPPTSAQVEVPMSDITWQIRNPWERGRPQAYLHQATPMHHKDKKGQGRPMASATKASPAPLPGRRAGGRNPYQPPSMSPLLLRVRAEHALFRHAVELREPPLDDHVGQLVARLEVGVRRHLAGQLLAKLLAEHVGGGHRRLVAHLRGVL